MKKHLFFAALLLGAFISCKKNNSGSSASYHVTATVNGKAETFNVNDVATKVSLGGATYISITGFVTSSPTGETLSLGLSNNAGGPAIKAGTYADTSTRYEVTGIYQSSITQQYLAGSNVFINAQGGGTPLTNHFVLVVTAIDSSSIKGTFSGDYFIAGSPGSDKKTITNGDFYVKFH